MSITYQGRLGGDLAGQEVHAEQMVEYCMDDILRITPTYIVSHGTGGDAVHSTQIQISSFMVEKSVNN